MSPPQLRGHVSTGVIAVRRARSARCARCRLCARASWLRSGSPAAAGIEPLAKRSDAAWYGRLRLPPHAPPGQHAALPIAGPDDQGHDRHPGTLSRPTRPGPFLPGSNQAPTWAGQRTLGRLNRTRRRGSTRS